MVKIEEKSNEKRKLKEKTDKLEEITRQKIRWHETIFRLCSKESFCINTRLDYLGKGKILVLPEYNVIVVSKSECSSFASNLLKIYEKETNGGWELERNY